MITKKKDIGTFLITSGENIKEIPYECNGGKLITTGKYCVLKVRGCHEATIEKY